MFTGIIQEVGTITERRPSGGGVHLTVNARNSSRLNVNDSVSVNGVCQTVIERGKNVFKVEAVEETLRKTTLGAIAVGRRVNIELPLRVEQMLGGHLVQGHVDDVGTVNKVTKQLSSLLLTIEVPSHLMSYIIPVGSIAIDGVSLTVARLEKTKIVLSIIPHTLANTTLGDLSPGSKVNIEVDLIGKYIERLLAPRKEAGSSFSEIRLKEWGYPGA